jgi:protein TonB
MFEQSILRPGAKTRRVWTVAAAFGIEAVGVAVAALIPVVAFETIPMVTLAPPPLVAPPGPPRVAQHMEVVAVVRERGPARPFVQPSRIPREIDMRVQPPQPESFDPGPYVRFSPGPSDPSAVGRGYRVPSLDLPVGPTDLREVAQIKPKETMVVPDKPVPVSRGVMQGRLIHKVIPNYPPLARAARIQGNVYLQAIIGRDGRVRQLQVKNGHAWLVQAALEAVGQWLYQPTTLSGVPVEILTEVEVKFTLSQ